MAVAARIVAWPDGVGVARELVLFLEAGRIVVWPDGVGIARELVLEGFGGGGGTIYEDDIIEDIDLTDTVEEEFAIDAEALYEDIEASEVIEDTTPVESVLIVDTAEVGDVIDEVFGDGGLFEQLVASEAIASQTDMAESIYEQVLALVIDLNADEVLEAWVVNLKTNAISRYSWPNFNSFAFVNGRYYAAKDDGIYELQGAADDGEAIPAFVTLGKTDFDSDQKKRTFAVYIDAETDGQMNLQVYADGQVYTYAFEIPPRNITGEMHETLRASPGRGLRARNWVFEIQNVDGSDFDMSKLRVLPIVLDRRVR